MKPRKSSISCPNLDNSKFMCNSNISSIFTENVRRGQCNSGSCSKERKHYYDAEKGLGKLPLPVDVIAEFMAKISMVKSKNSPVMKQASCAHVGGYRSAIVDRGGPQQPDRRAGAGGQRQPAWHRLAPAQGRLAHRLAVLFLRHHAVDRHGIRRAALQAGKARARWCGILLTGAVCGLPLCMPEAVNRSAPSRPSLEMHITDQPQNADHDQVGGDDVVEHARHDKNQYAGNQRHDGGKA